MTIAYGAVVTFGLSLGPLPHPVYRSSVDSLSYKFFIKLQPLRGKINCYGIYD